MYCDYSVEWEERKYSVEGFDWKWDSGFINRYKG